MPAPARQQPYSTQSLAINPIKGIVGHYSDVEIDALLAGVATGNVDLAGYAKTKDLPVVHEQAAEPVGKDGDLWIKPTVAGGGQPVATSSEVGELKEKVRYLLEDFLVDPSNAVASEFKEMIFDAVKVMLNGGAMPPPNMPWTACVQVAGTGNVEARVINGIVQLRGGLKITTTGWVNVRKLPSGFPKPPVESPSVVAGGEAGVAERLCQVVIKPDGNIYISPIGGKITDINLFSASAPLV